MGSSSLSGAVISEPAYRLAVVAAKAAVVIAALYLVYAKLRAVGWVEP
jgi:hypothetical protein